MNPYFETVIFAIIMGSSGAFFKYLNLSPFVFTFFRVAIPTIILLSFFMYKKERLFNNNFKVMNTLSLLHTLKIFLYFLGMSMTTIGNAVVLFYTWPIFTSILSHFHLKERFSKEEVMYIALAFLGVVVVHFSKMSFDGYTPLSLVFLISSALVFAYTVVRFKGESGKNSSYKLLFYQNFSGAIVFLPIFFLNVPTPSQIAVGSIYGLLAGFVGYFLFFSALKKIKASTVSNISNLEIISAVLFGVLLFGEDLTLNFLIGAGLIIFSAIQIRRKNK
ncbi:hypothetical protein BVX95_02055 [archaeon D22]|nr:hypothetical protein BVX95_02055 [archaeon D22]